MLPRLTKIAILWLRSGKGTVPRTLMGRTRYHMMAVTGLWASRKLRRLLAGPPRDRIARSIQSGDVIQIVSVPSKRGSRRDLRKARRRVKKQSRAQTDRASR